MALIPRPAAARGATTLEWLDSRHTFSFGDYVDPAHMGFRSLRVINDDRVAPGAGFPTHPHRDMEILTWVLEGALEHRDSMANGSVIRPGDAQIMSAGTGITHSEFNPSRTDPVHLLQIWMLPERRGLAPRYEQKAFPGTPGLRLIAAPGGRDGAVTVQQDVALWLSRLSAGEQSSIPLAPGRAAWVHVARGAVQANGVSLGSGDALAATGEAAITLTATAPAEVLVFDLA